MDGSFKLQPVLNYREKIEEALQQELAVIQAELQAQELYLVQLMAELGRLSGEIGELQRHNPVRIDAMLQAYGYADAVKGVIDDQQAAITVTRERLDEKRHEVVGAMRDRKTLDKLKERKQREYVAWMKRTEEKFVDDVTTIRFSRQVSERQLEEEHE